jgi:hypothetical protein
MSKQLESCEYAKHLERYLASLSKLYAAEGKRDLQELVVNSQTRLTMGWDYDNWNGGTYGHAVYLMVPEQVYVRVMRDLEVVGNQLKEDLNKLNNLPNEFVSAVFIEMEDDAVGEWRQQSGLLLPTTRVVPEKAVSRIWEEGCFRLFLSHKTEVKKETAELKMALRTYGISAFVAHEDIHPTEEWQNEIENALATMDGFIAIMTPDFHESNWTDQELGFAFARGVPIIALRMGRDPYGFIGKFQGLTASWLGASVEIAKLLIRQERMFPAFIKSIRECWGFDHGNRLADLLPAIERLSDQQIDELVGAYNEGGQAAGSYGFNGSKPRQHGPGLVYHLNRLGGRNFRYDGWKVVEEGTI